MQGPDKQAVPVELLPALVRSSSDIITVLDRGGSIIYASPAATRLLGYPEGSMDQRQVFDLVHPGDLSATRAAFAVGLKSPGTFDEPVELRLRHLNGSWRTVEVLGANVLDDPDVHGIVINARDVTERRVAEAALRESEERYRLLVERSPESIAVHQDGRFVFVNPAGLNLLGACSESDLLGRAVFDVVHPDDRDLVAARLSALGAGKEAELQEERLVRLDGRVIEVEAVAIPITYGGRPAAQVMAHDISDRKHAERNLAHQAMHDGLTELPNRNLFMDRLSHALARMSRSPSLLAVLFLDLDRFKVVNDSLGHGAGDRLLVSVARRLCDVLRPEDTVARFGGDEFVILCEELQDVTEATRIAQRIAEALAAPMFEGDEELRVQASIGIALAMTDLATPEEVVRDADAAMYRAKERGRGRLEIFDEAMRARAMGRLQQENALRRAIERGELRVHYQPIVSVSDGRAVGAEALLRWEHPERGLVGPDEFISVAEDSGLIVPIGEWVLHEACRQAREWNDARSPGAPALEVAVNLSARQLLQPDLVHVVTRMLAGSSVDPDVINICLEITESVLMDDVVVTLRTLERLRELGVRLAIDDFGTGYSSLAYLSRFPIDTLKVDRAFVRGLCEQHHDRAIVASIIELARALGLTVVAEGVETEDQLAVLRQLGCDLAQGFLFARPAPPEACTMILRHDAPVRAL